MMWSRSSRPGVARVVAALLVLVGVASCTSNDESGAATDSTSSSTPRVPTHVGATTKLTRPDAELRVTIEQLRGGIRGSARTRLVRGMARPIAGWIDGGFLTGAYPRRDFPHAFATWTSGAARLGERDRGVTTNSALSRQLVGVVADEQRARCFVFASKGKSGGATAQIWLRMTVERRDGSLGHVAITGDLYLTREARTWSVFGYDLDRSVTS